MVAGEGKYRTSFVTKCLAAQEAGAVLCMVGNYDDSTLRPAFGKVDDGRANVTIPVIGVTKSMATTALGGAGKKKPRFGLSYDVDQLHNELPPKICTVGGMDSNMDEAQAFYMRGISMEEMKKKTDYLQAIDLYQRTVALHPRHADAYNNLGHI